MNALICRRQGGPWMATAFPWDVLFDILFVGPGNAERVAVERVSDGEPRPGRSRCRRSPRSTPRSGLKDPLRFRAIGTLAAASRMCSAKHRT